MYKQKHKTKTSRSENKTKAKTQIDNKTKGYKISSILVLPVC